MNKSLLKSAVITAVALVFVILNGAFTHNVQAASPVSPTITRNATSSDGITVQAQLTNATFGQTNVSIQQVDLEEHGTVQTLAGTEESKTAIFEVDFIIPSQESSDNKGTVPNRVISPLSSIGSTNNAGGIKASLYVNYTSGSGDKIRFNSVSGAWTPTSSMYYLTGKQVVVSAGSILNWHEVHYPSGNSFNYSLNTGFLAWMPNADTSLTGARSYAVSHVYSMPGTHNINLTVAIPIPRT